MEGGMGQHRDGRRGRPSEVGQERGTDRGTGDWTVLEGAVFDVVTGPCRLLVPLWLGSLANLSIQT